MSDTDRRQCECCPASEGLNLVVQEHTTVDVPGMGPLPGILRAYLCGTCLRVANLRRKPGAPYIVPLKFISDDILFGGANG